MFPAGQTIYTYIKSVKSINRIQIKEQPHKPITIMHH